MSTGQAKVIRAFIAVYLPENVKAALEKIGQVLAAQVPPGSVRWVKPALMHLTIRFLGDTAVSQLPALTAGLDQIAAGQAAFTLYLDRLGCFPNEKRPRVIWVGLGGADEAAQRLSRAIEAHVVALGWRQEGRPFQAHLTLGRVNDGRQLAGLKWDVPVARLAVPVMAVHLVESQLRPSGPLYTTWHSSELKG
jgi:2'-5' RNA ligase